MCKSNGLHLLVSTSTRLVRFKLNNLHSSVEAVSGCLLPFLLISSLHLVCQFRRWPAIGSGVDEGRRSMCRPGTSVNSAYSVRLNRLKIISVIENLQPKL